MSDTTTFSHPDYTFVHAFEGGEAVIRFKTTERFRFGSRFPEPGLVLKGTPAAVDAELAESARMLVYTSDSSITLQLSLALANELARDANTPILLHLNEVDGRTFLVATTNALHCDVDGLHEDLTRVLAYAENAQFVAQAEQEVETDPLDTYSINDPSVVVDDGNEEERKEAFASALSSHKAEIVPGEMIP